MSEENRKRIVRRAVGATDAASATGPTVSRPWRLLVVDDEPGIHAVTQLNLSGFQFDGRGLEILSARSAAEARQLLARERDIALALIDVVMETPDAGLELVRHIREESGDHLIRLVIRTGQPGVAPERYVIEHFDIDDYKEKTELTAQKLFTTVRTGLKAYRDLCHLEKHRHGLTRVLDGTPVLFRYKGLTALFVGVLEQLLDLCRMANRCQSGGARSGEWHFLVADCLESPDGGMRFRCGTGRFREDLALQEETIQRLHALLHQEMGVLPLQRGEGLFPLISRGWRVGFIYLSVGGQDGIPEAERQLVQVLVNQCSAALESQRLFQEVHLANRQTVFILGTASEYKDRETGNHINRIAHYTRSLARMLGEEAERAEELALASTLHDVGKLGIPDAVLQKPGRLTAEEMLVIRTHPEIGLRILGERPGFELAREIAGGHHERWDGAGYPYGLAGEAIPYSARLVAVADVFDALVSVRPYKKSWTPEEAMMELCRGAGSHFDPIMTDAFAALYENGAILEIRERFPSD
ncbi:MAG: DUF3369 domain-containing protein [Magnetococcales bacterium]|nr:DUF3369 domain-containing protein [Magnetococcales bacterium]